MYFVTRVFFDKSGVQSNSIQKFDDIIPAQKRFYSVLATDIDNDNYQYELVQIVRDTGETMASQVFDNRFNE